MSPDPHSAYEMPLETRKDRLRLAVLGVNAWLVVLVIPSVHAGVVSAIDLVTFGAPLALLVAGILLLRGDEPRFARWSLLAAFPAAVGALIATKPGLVELDAYGVFGASAGALSLVAFVATAARAVSRGGRTMTSETQPLVGKEPVVEPAQRRWMRRALLALATLGVFALAVVIPAWPDRRERMASWGEASADGAVLATLVSALVAAVALGTLVGPGLRAERPTRDEPVLRRRRLAVAVLLGSSAAVGWLVLRQLEP
jgi:hypothetical protein